MLNLDIQTKKLLAGIIFHNLRILYKVEPRDTYILNYLNHWEKNQEEFFDLYSLAFAWGRIYQPKNVLEIGSRTGLSLVQLLSGYIKYPQNMRICLFDLWDDTLGCPEVIKKYLDYLAIPSEKIEFYQGDSRETVSKFIKTNTDKFNYISVDGGHIDEIASIDLENAYKLIAKDGIIIFDDIAATIKSDNINLKPTWQRFKQKYFDEFLWREDLAGKGTAWAIKK